MGSPALLVPIGHSIGPRHDDVPKGHVNQIRVGADVLEPSDTQFIVWALAHGLPDRLPGSGSWTRQAVHTAAHELGLADETEAGDCVDELLRLGLLAEVEPDAPAAMEFALRHRLLPLALGLGVQPEAEGMAGVGLLFQPLVLLSPALADLWQWAELSPDLWSACQESAAVAEAGGMADPDQVDPERVLAGLLTSLHAMLSTRVACVDVRLGTDRQR
jgi:hypothetical protein